MSLFLLVSSFATGTHQVLHASEPVLPQQVCRRLAKPLPAPAERSLHDGTGNDGKAFRDITSQRESLAKTL